MLSLMRSAAALNVSKVLNRGSNATVLLSSSAAPGVVYKTPSTHHESRNVGRRSLWCTTHGPRFFAGEGNVGKLLRKFRRLFPARKARGFEVRNVRTFDPI